MAAVQRRLVAGIAVHGGHDAAFDAERIMQRLGHRRQTVGGARPVRYHRVRGLQFAVVHAVDHRAVDVLARCRQQHAFRALIQMHLCQQPVVELARAFQHDVAPFPVQLVHLVGRHDLHLSAPQIQRAVADFDFIGKTPVDGIVFDQMCRSLQRAGRVDAHHLDVIPARCRDMRQGAAADAAKSVDTDFDGHGGVLWQRSGTLPVLYLVVVNRGKG